MDVTFETTEGLRFTVEIWYFATVRVMKEHVRQHAGIPVESQRLFFHGRELEDDRDAEHYSILHGSHVLIVLSDGGSGVVVHVVAFVPAAAVIGAGGGGGTGTGTVMVDVDASCTVARLKEILQELTGGSLPAAEVSVSFETAEMEDGKALAEYLDPPPPADETTMEVRVAVQQQQRRVLLEVKWGAGTSTTMVDVSETAAVWELRGELGGAAAQLLLPDDGSYFFVYKQSVMEEDRTLRWYGLKNGDTIEIVHGRDVAAALERPADVGQ